MPSFKGVLIYNIVFFICCRSIFPFISTITGTLQSETLCKTPKFQRISWYRNLVKVYSFGRVSGTSAEPLQKLCVSQNLDTTALGGIAILFCSERNIVFEPTYAFHSHHFAHKINLLDNTGLLAT